MIPKEGIEWILNCANRERCHSCKSKTGDGGHLVIQETPGLGTPVFATIPHHPDVPLATFTVLCEGCYGRVTEAAVIE
jgi:ferredoxin